MKLGWRRAIPWGVGGIVAMLILVALMPRPVPSELAPVARGPIRVTLDEEGETRVRDRFVVSAPFDARVQRVDLEPGDPVRARETVLATLVPVDPDLLDARRRSESEARLRAAEAALGRARAEHARVEQEHRRTETELGRVRDLAAGGVLSQQVLDRAEIEEKATQEALAAADFEVRARQQEKEAARSALVEAGGQAPGSGSGGVFHLLSPVSGVVLRLLRESESVVRGGDPILEVADPENLEIVVDFLSADAVHIQPGYPVLIEQWGGDCPIRGRVRRVEPSGFTKVSALGVEEKRVNVVIDFQDPRAAWKSLGDGYRVEARVIVWESRDALKVPASALFRSGEDWAVFAVVDGRAALRPVEIGHRNAVEAEVLGGLSEGERVVTYPGEAVRDGVAVKGRS